MVPPRSTFMQVHSPERIAILDLDRTHAFTYQHLGADSAQLAVEISQYLRIKKSEQMSAQATPRVCVLATGYDFVAAQWAVWQAGAMVVPLCDSHPQSELGYAITTSDPAMVICSSSLASRVWDLNLPVPVSTVASTTSISSGSGIILDLSNSYNEAKDLARNLHAKHVSVRQWNKQHAAHVSARPLHDDLPDHVAQSGSGALMIFTSGTTSRPKGVVHTHASLDAMTSTLVDAWQWQPSDIVLHTLPLHHVHGLINGLQCAMWAGATVDMRRGKFSPDTVWSALTGQEDNAPAVQCTPTRFMAVPAMYHKLLQQTGNVLKEEHVRGRSPAVQCFSGSAPLPAALGRAWTQRTGGRLLERYGMTEVGMALSNPFEPEEGRVLGSVGWPLPGVMAAVAPDREARPQDVQHGDGEEGGVTGELWLAGPSVFDHYWRREEATAEAFKKGSQLPAGTVAYEGVNGPAAQRAMSQEQVQAVPRWFQTGDMVARDLKGRWRILGRASADIIKVGGYKVSALEAETVMLDHEAVGDVSVLGIPDEDAAAVRQALRDKWDSSGLEPCGHAIAALEARGMGETVLALAVRAPVSTNASAQEVQEWALGQMAPYKSPRAVVWVEEIPRNAMGKVNKKQLLQLLISGKCELAQ